MKWVLLVLAFAGLVGIAIACSGPVTRGALKRLMYEEPSRDRWQRPQQVVEALELAPGDRVADVGAGGGYFTYPIAEVVGEGGKVYAVDIDTSLLAYVAHQAEKRGLPQIETVEAPEDGPGLPDASVDLIFLANVFHHLPAPDRYFAGARRVLRPGGRVAIVELAGGRGFHKAHSTPPEEIKAQLEKAGYALAETHDFLEHQSFLVFEVRGGRSEVGS